MSSTLRMLAVSSLLGLFSCAPSVDIDDARATGRAQAEADFAAGRAEMVMVCGTIAPGPCSSVAEELWGQAWAVGYNGRLRELQRARASSR